MFRRLKRKDGYSGSIGVGLVVSMVGLALYAVGFYPYLNQDKYREQQRSNRHQMRKVEDHSGLEHWVDPFREKKE